MTYFQQQVERITKEIGLKDHVYERIMGPAILAVLDDTCGNFIQIVQVK